MSDEMNGPVTELLQAAERLERFTVRGRETTIRDGLVALEKAATEIGKAWSGSWLGYHAFTYYHNLQAPPPGSHFSQEWGLMDTFSNETSEEWLEFDPDELEAAIRDLAGDPDLDPARQLAEEATRAFKNDKSEILSILTTELADSSDSFLNNIKGDIEKLSILSKAAVSNRLIPSGQAFTRDSLALGQGYRIPPHVSVISEVIAFRQPIKGCTTLSDLARKGASHISRKRGQHLSPTATGANIFIGHGRSPLWRDLKDFFQDRLGMPWDEFNRVPVAGVTSITRLSDMLDSAAIAFLVMTGEDEQSDGSLNARLNVIHEAGLFQGRLGFSRAIILLEEGCEEFSNIEGLGQIRFPSGNIKAAFEEIRRVLERENIIDPDN